MARSAPLSRQQEADLGVFGYSVETIDPTLLEYGDERTD
jgi:hypothetical protein